MGLEIGSILSLNDLTGNYEFKKEDRVVSEKGSYTTNNSVIISENTIELWLNEIFEEVLDINEDSFKYVKPLIVKAYYDKESNQYILMDVNKKIVKLYSNIFDKLFKTIE